MHQKILVPFDGSEPAKHALVAALDLVSLVPGGQVTILKVREKVEDEAFRVAARMASVTPDVIETTLEGEAGEAALQTLKDSTARIVAGKEDLVTYDVIGGNPHDAIVAYAARGDYDCISMGHRGMSAVRAMLGSVCYSVLGKSDIPVYIAK